MNVFRRVVLIGFVVGVVFATASVGFANPTVAFHDCPAPSPSPSPTPAVSPPVTAPPNSAAPTPTPSPPPDNCTPMSTSVLRGTHTLAFTVSSDGFQLIKSVTLVVLADNDKSAHDASSPLFNKTYDCNNQPPPTSILVPWDTTKATPYNGHYKVSVTAIAYADRLCDSSNHPSSATATRSGLIVDNPPSAVNAPRIIATTASTVSIGWDASTAPDTARYEVYRAVTNSAKSKPETKDFQPWGYSTSTSFRDNQVGPGTYWYSVVVTRRSVVTPDSGISSPLSDPSPPVTIAAPPVPSNPVGGAPRSTVRRYIPLNPIVLPPSQAAVNPPVPDAPYSAQLPYGNVPEAGPGGLSGNGSNNSESGATDPRGPVLPVAVGAFLVSAALALGRMPY